MNYSIGYNADTTLTRSLFIVIKSVAICNVKLVTIFNRPSTSGNNNNNRPNNNYSYDNCDNNCDDHNKVIYLMYEFQFIII